MTPNPFDRAARYLAKLDPLGFLRWVLLRLALTVSFRGWLDARTVPFPGDPERTCDTVAGLVDAAAADFWWGIPLEFQTRPDREMLGRMLEYLGRLHREGRPHGVGPEQFGVLAVVVNLTGRGSTSRDLRLKGTGLRTCLQVGERNLEEEDAARTLAAIARGRVARCVLPLIPLMQGGAELGTIARWKRLAQAKPDARRRADYAGLALVFSELTGCRDVWKEALRGWNVEQSLQVLEWQAQAREQGKVEGKVEAILELLTTRFSSAGPAGLAEVVRKIRATDDLARLKHWLIAAGTAATFEDFRRIAQV